MKKEDNLYLRVAAITLIINFSLDRITKLIAINYLEGRDTISLFFNTVVLRYTENTGAFLSTGAEWSDAKKYLFLVIIPLLACLYGLYYVSFRVKSKALVITIVSIIAGGLGNLYDRIFNHFSVVDFLNFGIGPVRTGILNVADMSVTFGVIYLMIYQLRKKEASPSGK